MQSEGNLGTDEAGSPSGLAELSPSTNWLQSVHHQPHDTHVQTLAAGTLLSGLANNVQLPPPRPGANAAEEALATMAAILEAPIPSVPIEPGQSPAAASHKRIAEEEPMEEPDLKRTRISDPESSIQDATKVQESESGNTGPVGSQSNGSTGGLSQLGNDLTLESAKALMPASAEGGEGGEEEDGEEGNKMRYVEYECGYCSQFKVSTSSGADGRVRIRCECGGKHRDNKPRMHAKWVARPGRGGTQEELKGRMRAQWRQAGRQAGPDQLLAESVLLQAYGLPPAMRGILPMMQQMAAAGGMGGLNNPLASAMAAMGGMDNTAAMLPSLAMLAQLQASGALGGVPGMGGGPLGLTAAPVSAAQVPAPRSMPFILFNPDTNK